MQDKPTLEEADRGSENHFEMKGILLSTQIENISTRRDRTLKIVIGTQELNPSDGGQLLAMHNSIAVVYICPKEIDQRVLDQVDKIDPEFGGKTQSKRIRDVLFVAWSQESKGFKTFDQYYKHRTEQFIEMVKNELEPA